MRKVYSTLFVLAIFIIVIYIFVESRLISATYEEKMRPFSDGWTAGPGEQLALSEVKPQNYGGSYLITKWLPDDIGDDDCF